MKQSRSTVLFQSYWYGLIILLMISMTEGRCTAGPTGATGAVGPTGPANTNITFVNSQSWPITASQTASVNTIITFSKTGHLVSVALPAWEVTQTSAGFVTLGSVNLPNELQPSAAYNSGISAGDIYLPGPVAVDNGVGTGTTLQFSAEPVNWPSVNIFIGSGISPDINDFSGSGRLFMYCFSFSYFTD